MLTLKDFTKKDFGYGVRTYTLSHKNYEIALSENDTVWHVKIFGDNNLLESWQFTNLEEALEAISLWKKQTKKRYE